MADENTPDYPDAGVPDTTPTEPVPAVEPVELADQQPIAEAPAAPAPAAASGRNHTRTILEIVGGVVAAGLIIVAGVGGFAAGIAVGDGDGRHGDDRWNEHSEAGGQMGQGFGDEGFGDEGFGGRGGQMDQGRGGQMDQGRGGHMDGGQGFGDQFNGQELDREQFGEHMDEMLQHFMDEFGQDQGMAPDSAPQTSPQG